MPARLYKLSRRNLAELRQMVISFEDVDPDAAQRLIAAIDRQKATDHGWTFVMIGPEQHAAVVRWLRSHSDRPLIAVGLWAELFTALDTRTGEILLTREEMGERSGTAPAGVSRVMTQLESIGAIIKRKEGRTVRYFMNPLVGTHLGNDQRVRAQAKAPALRLVV